MGDPAAGLPAAAAAAAVSMHQVRHLGPAAPGSAPTAAAAAARRCLMLMLLPLCLGQRPTSWRPAAGPGVLLQRVTGWQDQPVGGKHGQE